MPPQSPGLAFDGLRMRWVHVSTGLATALEGAPAFQLEPRMAGERRLDIVSWASRSSDG